ncbi:MAG TPA: DUF932 domain-containing protein [Bacteroidales bacterium]|nr:DUF932 domain-containing protein [Bacteroidales bacterium]
MESNMKLNFKTYVGGKGVVVDRTGLEQVATPEPLGRWFPIPHITLVNELEKALAPHNLRITEETYKLDKAGNRMFGMLQVANGSIGHEDYSFMVGLKNAHDKMMRAGLAVGMGVFVCSNLSFRGEIVIGRKHTTAILEDLPMLMTGAITKLAQRWNEQDKIVEAYKNTEVGKLQARDLLIQMAQRNVFPRTQFMDVMEEWEAPRHPEFKGRNLWNLFSSVTENLKPRENSSGSTLWLLQGRTERLHSILDPVAGIQSEAPEVSNEVDVETEVA